MDNYNNALEIHKQLSKNNNDSHCEHYNHIIQYYINIGLTLDNYGNYQEAIEYYNRALEIDSANVIALDNKGYAF